MNCYDQIEQTKETYRATLPKPEPALPPKVQRSLTCIHNHLFDRRLTVAWMRERCGINGHHFASGFARHLGKKPHRYISYHRSEAAKQLLSDPNLEEISISDISYELGYTEPAVFTNAFKRLTGEPPFNMEKKKWISRNGNVGGEITRENKRDFTSAFV